MTERTVRIGALPLTLMIAALMTCLTGCGGCSSEPGATGQESVEQSTEAAENDSGSRASGTKGGDVAAPLGDAGRTKARSNKGAKTKAEAATNAAAARAQTPGALDANAKRLAKRKTLEADLKKRASRRRDDGRGEAVNPATPAATAPLEPTAAPVDSPLARAVPKIGDPATGKAAKGTQPAPPKPRLLNVGRYMTITDARRITGDATLSKGAPLTGIEPGPNYNVSYFAPQLRSKFGVSVQVWKEKIRRDANDRFRKMKRDFTNVETTTAVSPSAIFSHFQGIMTLSFADLTKSIVVSVSCGDSVCDDQELVALANAVKKKI